MTLDYVKYVLPMRRRYQARGLTVWGKPRRDANKKRRPELSGLRGREYHAAHMRLWRAERT